MKNIRYSEHLRYKMSLRNIDKKVVEKIFIEPDMRFYDNLTGYQIALKRMNFQGKEKELSLVYKETEDDIVLITVHPLKEGQSKSRTRSGRWKKLQD